MRDTSVYLSDVHIAKRYAIGRTTVWRWVQQGRFPQPVRLSNSCTRWRLADLEAWEQSRQKGAA